MSTMYKEIELFVQYAVPAEKCDQAMALVSQYQHDRVALRLLHEYYRSLPEAREEPVRRLVQIDSHQGVLLLGVLTVNHQYLYLVTEHEVVLLGEQGEAVENEILSFFGYTDQEEFTKACQHLRELGEYRSDRPAGKMKCPVCSVFEGELHQLGCPVEICPWCEGQLSRCNCRFDQLGVEIIKDEEELLKFQQLLAAKGRIRFIREQAPSYPTAGTESVEVEEPGDTAGRGQSS